MNRVCLGRWWVGAALLLTAAWQAPAQYAETARVLDSAGNWATNASRTVLFAAGQTAGAGVSSNALYRNESGFLHGLALFPAADADADGIADENDVDDDGDGLPDGLELAGAAFAPTTPTDPLSADSDNDGAPDGNEARAGTNPTDAASRLRVVSARAHAEEVVLTWSSRAGTPYALLRAATPEATATGGAVVARVTGAGGGAAPWFETRTSVTNLTQAGQPYYRVRVEKP